MKSLHHECVNRMISYKCHTVKGPLQFLYTESGFGILDLQHFHNMNNNLEKVVCKNDTQLQKSASIARPGHWIKAVFCKSESKINICVSFVLRKRRKRSRRGVCRKRMRRKRLRGAYHNYSQVHYKQPLLHQIPNISLILFPISDWSRS